MARAMFVWMGLFLVSVALLIACVDTFPSASPTRPSTLVPSSPPSATTAFTSTPGNASPMQLMQAFTATQTLRRYHYTYEVTGSLPTSTVALEGNYVGPGDGYVRGMIGGHPVEKLFTQGSIFQKEGGGWVRQDPLLLEGQELVMFVGARILYGEPINFLPLDFMSYYFPIATDVRDLGEESLDGHPVRHLRFTLNDARWSTQGTGSAWLDSTRQYIRKLTLDLDGPANTTTPIVDNAGSSPSPSTPIHMSYTIALTQLDDPAVTLPSFDLAAALAQPTVTPTGQESLPPLVQAALTTLDTLQQVEYRRTDTAMNSESGVYIPAHAADWRRIHANTYPIETDLSYLAIGMHFVETTTQTTINGVTTRAFEFDIPHYGASADGSLVVAEIYRNGKIPPIGKGTVYIDPTTNYILELVIYINETELSGGSTPGENTETVILTRHNDPKLANPTPP